VPLTNGSIPQESTARASKGQALQLAHGLDFLSIQAYRLWMEYPSRGKVIREHPDERRPERMKSAVRSPAFRWKRLASRSGSASDASA
jgi:hypothetical protein